MSHHVPNIKPKRTVRTVSGSARHTAKTHGSHNERTRSWPHLSDRLDRPVRLPDLEGVRRGDRERGRRHKRASWPQVRTPKHLYQDGSFDLPHMPVWVVSGRCAHDGVTVYVTTTARDEDEALTNGERVLAYQHMTAIANIEAERR